MAEQVEGNLAGYLPVADGCSTHFTQWSPESNAPCCKAAHPALGGLLCAVVHCMRRNRGLRKGGIWHTHATCMLRCFNLWSFLLSGGRWLAVDVIDGGMCCQSAPLIVGTVGYFMDLGKAALDLD